MKPEYYKCINLLKGENNAVKIGHIYQLSENPSSYVDCYRLYNLGHWTTSQFEPATEEEYLIQEGKITKKEQNYDYLIVLLKELNIT